ncbi:MAG: TauD/TfdA family dioxygenase [Myxococcota bacterium]
MSALPSRFARPAHLCREWDATTLWARPGWRMSLPGDVVEEARSTLRHQPSSAEDLDDFNFDPAATPLLARFGHQVRERLLRLEGICWIQGLDGSGLSEEEQRFVYLALGMAMGEVLEPYGRLYTVKDRGVDYTTSAVPVSATAAATGFHTDSSSVDTWPDIVGLLCESPSSQGGESLISNGLRAHRELRLRAPEAIAILEQDFIRDVVTPGRARTRANLLRNRFPIFGNRGAPTLRYMRYWVERGQSAAGLPLSHRQTAALDALDEVLQAPENVVQFRLERGDMLFLDNRILAHNRLAYQDTDGDTRRLQRIWVSTA